MVTARRVDGIDISHHQSRAIDMVKAKKAGLKWLYHKATEGTTVKDRNYGKRRAEAKAAGIPFGAYHFARADLGDAEAEAKFFLAYAAPKPGDLRPCLDLETTEGLSLSQIRTWAKTFIAVVEKATSVKPIVYTPYDLGTADDGCIIWRPRYNNTNTPPVLKWDIWQFSNGQYGVPKSFVGFGNVDLNTMRSGLKVSDLQIPRKKKPEPKPPKKVAKLRFAHASLQYSDTDKQHTADIELLFSRKYDVITGTEAGKAGSGNTPAELERCAKKYGYVLALYDRYDTWSAVKKSLVFGNVKEGAHFGIWRSSKTKPKPAGRWGDKAIVFVAWDMGPTFGKQAVGCVHYATWGGAGTAKLKNQLDTQYAKEVAEWVNKQPEEANVWVTGDFNRNDKKFDVFMGQVPMMTCWDDLKVWPNTGHGNIDAIARHKNDSRVRCVCARVLDDGDLFMNTDHFLVEAEYEVRAL